MKKTAIILSVISYCLLVTGCASKASITESSLMGNLDKLLIESPALADNTTKEPSKKTVYVFLPPGYETSAQKYPVVYYLHGFGGDSSEMFGFENAVVTAMEQNKAEPFILVAVSGANSLGGSFYVNSKVTGRWEDNITNEIIPLIDGRYRTLAAAGSRGLMGFSMGGFGALHLGLAHPDLFGAVWALCPGVFVPEKGLVDAMPTWKGSGSFLEAYAAAFSKDNKIPQFDGSAPDNAVIAEWEAGFGGWTDRIGQYKALKNELRGIRIVYGEYDGYRWITEGSQYLAGLMNAEGLPVELQAYAIGHMIQAWNVIEDALPFFERTLTLE